MQTVSFRIALAAPLLLGGVLLAGSASALTFDVSGQTFPGVVTAQVELTWDGTDTLTVEITNTSTATTAVVTGFAFNVPDAVTGISAFTASGTLDDASWQDLFGAGNGAGEVGNAPGGYSFEAAGASGNNIAGGQPNDGFGIGDSATFTFTFTGAGLNALTENDFASELSSGASADTYFGVRFQAVNTDDVVGGSDFAIVPAPGAAWLVGLGLLELRRRRRR